MNIKHRSRWFFNVNLFVLSLLFAGHLAATASPAGQQDQEGKNEKNIKQFIGEREKDLKALSQLSISAAAGFTGNTSGQSNLYQLGLGVAVSKEMYPGEFSFHTNTSLVIQNSVLQENVTTMSMSYEHNLSSWLETYGFIERFSDTFLRLQYRYEIGGGFKAEVNVMPNKWKKQNDNYAQIQQNYYKYIAYLQELEHQGEEMANDPELPAMLSRLLDLKKQENGIMAVARKKNSLVRIGLALSVFSELEKPETIAELGNNQLIERQHFRLSIRPSIIFKPSRLLTLSGTYYYKHPLFKRDNPDDPQHFRTDTRLNAALNLSQGSSWAKNVSLIFEYQRHEDNNPFGLKDHFYSLLNLAPNLVNDTHETFMIKLNVEF